MMTVYSTKLTTEVDYWWQSCSKSFLIDILVKPGGLFKFGPLEKIADIFGRDLGANLFRNGPWNSIPPSNLASRRVVTELGYMTILSCFIVTSTKGLQQHVLQQ